MVSPATLIQTVSWLAVSVLAAHVALIFMKRSFKRPSDRLTSILCGAAALGICIWATHAAALHWWAPAFPADHDLSLVLFAGLASGAACALALNSLVAGPGSLPRVLVAAALVGAALGLMHYGAVSATRILPTPGYRPDRFSGAMLLAAAGFAAVVAITVQQRHAGTARALAENAASVLILSGALLLAHRLAFMAMVVERHREFAEPALDPSWWFLVQPGVFLAALIVLLVAFGGRGRANPPEEATEVEESDARADDGPDRDQLLPGRGALNRLLRQASEEQRMLSLVILKFIRIRPTEELTSTAGHPRRVVLVGQQIQSAIPNLLVTRLEDDQLALAELDTDVETLLGKLARALPWQERCRSLQIDLRAGAAEFPRECPAIFQLVPRAGACFQPWPQIRSPDRASGGGAQAE